MGMGELPDKGFRPAIGIDPSGVEMAKARIMAGGEHGHGLGGIGAATALHGPKGERAGHDRTMPSPLGLCKRSSGACGFSLRSAGGIDERADQLFFTAFNLSMPKAFIASFS